MPHDPGTADHEATAQTADHAGAWEEAYGLWDALCGLATERFRLAALETRRAGESLVMMILAGVVAGILLSGAWMGLMVAIVLGLIEQGVTASNALLLAVCVNLLALLVVSWVIRRKLKYLQFPATLGSLQATPGAQPGARSR
jgi:uncharacterized membrane protein YqjE